MKYPTVFAVLLGLAPALSLASQDIPTLSAIPHPLRWEGQPEACTAREGALTMVAAKGTDMFRDPAGAFNTDSAPKLLFKADTNFVFAASITHTFAHKWDAGAIVLRADERNWVKFCFEKDYKGTHRVVSVVTRGFSDDSNSVEIEGNTVFFKVSRAGSAVTLYSSVDGKDWYIVRHFRFEVTGDIEVGFLAQAPIGERCEVTFANISYEARKIEPVYSGK